MLRFTLSSILHFRVKCSIFSTFFSLQHHALLHKGLFFERPIRSQIYQGVQIVVFVFYVSGKTLGFCVFCILHFGDWVNALAFWEIHECFVFYIFREGSKMPRLFGEYILK